MKGQRGLTLVETMSSLAVFTMMTVGITPVLVTSINGADQTRSATVAKTLAEEALERARGLPYYVSYDSQNSRVDVLDLYHPRHVPSGVTETVCTGGSTDAACPKDVPANHTVTFEAGFVKGIADDLAAEETFETVEPPVSYAWDQTNGGDSPATNILQFSVTVAYPTTHGVRDFTLESILGDRKFNGITVSGAGRVEHGVKVLTHFEHPNATGVDESTLRAIDGNVEAQIETQELSTATLSLRAADVDLNELAPSGETGDEIDSGLGVMQELRAPPAQSPANMSQLFETTSGDGTVTHDLIGTGLDVAAADKSATETLKVDVANELPLAQGSYIYTKENGVRDLEVWNDLDEVNAEVLQLDGSRPMVYARPWNDGANVRTFKGTGLAETKALSAGDRQVHTQGSTELYYLGILPAAYIPSSGGPGSFSSVLVVDSFTATADCKAAPSSAAAATATWSAGVRYWSDSSDNGVADGGYVSLTLDQDNAGAQLQEIGNPLVYDGPLPSDDVYLFDDPAEGRRGYLTSFVAGSATTQTSEGGRVASANIPGALLIETVPVNPSMEASTFNISLGSVSCEAVDRR